jgi:hypothetical protein
MTVSLNFLMKNSITVESQLISVHLQLNFLYYQSHFLSIMLPAHKAVLFQTYSTQGKN